MSPLLSFPQHLAFLFYSTLKICHLCLSSRDDLRVCCRPAASFKNPKRSEKRNEWSHDSSRWKEKAVLNAAAEASHEAILTGGCWGWGASMRDPTAAFYPRWLQLQRLFYSLTYSADKSWRSAESKMHHLLLREQKRVPPLMPSGNGQGFFFFFFALCFFVFPLRGESLTEGGRFCLTPAMFAAPASWEWKPLNSLSWGKKRGTRVLSHSPVRVSLRHLFARGGCEVLWGVQRRWKGPSMLSTGPPPLPILPHAWTHHTEREEKDRVSANSLWIY